MHTMLDFLTFFQYLILDNQYSRNMSPPANLSVTNRTSIMSNELFAGYSDELLNIATFGCILFVVIGVPGNILTIFALSRGKQVSRTVYHDLWQIPFNPYALI